jgi:hypothetical protein
MGTHKRNPWELLGQTGFLNPNWVGKFMIVFNFDTDEGFAAEADILPFNDLNDRPDETIKDFFFSIDGFCADGNMGRLV